MSNLDKFEPEEILDLFGKRPQTIRPGLERIKRALEELGSPGLETVRIVIGGTNGKGTTSSYTWQLLDALGFKVGLFTSPHLVEFRERYFVSGSEITNEHVVDTIKYLRNKLTPSLWEELTFFEISTILAFLIFDSLKTDINILEVGLGGRFDCVNVYDPHISVITSIGLDHMEFLGENIRLIAREKAGIMRLGKTTFFGGRLTTEEAACKIIQQCAQEMDAKLVELQSSDLVDFPSKFRDRPQYLKCNFALAREAVKQVLRGQKRELSNSEIVSLYDNQCLVTPIPARGRFDPVTVSKGDIYISLLLDVCHNPHGAAAFSRGIKSASWYENGRGYCSFVSILQDKNIDGIGAELEDVVGVQLLFKCSSPRTWQHAGTKFKGRLYRDFAEAWNLAIGNPNWRSQRPWLVFGSVTAIGEVIKFWMDHGWKVEPGWSV